MNSNPMPSRNPDVEPPEIIKHLIGENLPIQEDYRAYLQDRYTFDPPAISGEVDGDPRDSTIYPDDGKAMVDLLTDTGEQPLLGEEFSMVLQASQGTPVDLLPPEPLTPRNLDRLLSDLVDDTADYEAWVPMETEIIDQTAVGEFRQLVPGSILRFHVDVGETMSMFTLLPDRSPTGFSWYYLSTQPADGNMMEGLLDAEEAQRLSSLLTADGDRILESVPDRIKNASNLLSTHLHANNHSPTPDGWLTTHCEVDMEAGEFLAPRYEATFVHKSEDFVIEVKPINAESVIDSESSEVSSTETKIKIHDPNGDGTHTWELHFAPDPLTETIEQNYPVEINGPDFLDMMESINNLLER